MADRAKAIRDGRTTEASDDSPDARVDLSVVIPTYNAVDSVGQQLEALLGQHWTGTWEVVLVDNGSTDGTVEVLERIARSSPRVRLIDASQHPGAAHARNRGVDEARGRFIAFCDADDVVADGWLAAIGNALRRSPFVTGPQEYERLNPAWLHGVYGNVAGHELQTFEGVFPFGPTANLGIHRDLFEQVGRFDTSVSVGEDLDLCLRVWLHGVELEYVPAAAIHYRHRPTMRTLWRQAITYGQVRPMISRRLSDEGCSTPSRWRGARNWAWLVRRLPSLRSRAGRARWIAVAGGSAGRVIGSIRHRYVVL